MRDRDAFPFDPSGSGDWSFHDPPGGRDRGGPPGPSSGNRSRDGAGSSEGLGGESLLAFTTASFTTGLHGVLSGPGPVTVFAPRDEAFDEFPKALVAELFGPRHRAELSCLLAHHVVDGEIRLEESGAGLLFPRSSEPIVVRRSGGGLHVGEARVLSGPHPASNGLVYVVDRVLLPRSAGG